jgi:hypothetical protein
MQLSTSQMTLLCALRDVAGVRTAAVASSPLPQPAAPVPPMHSSPPRVPASSPSGSDGPDESGSGDDSDGSGHSGAPRLQHARDASPLDCALTLLLSCSHRPDAVLGALSHSVAKSLTVN